MHHHLGDFREGQTAPHVGDNYFPLNRLPLEEREVIVAHVWGGMTFAEIAELVGTSTSSVHRRYQAGLQTLRNLLGEKCLPTTDSTKHCRKS